MGIKTCTFELDMDFCNQGSYNFDAKDYWTSVETVVNREITRIKKLGIRVNPEINFKISGDKVTGTYKILEGTPRVFLFMGSCIDIDNGYMLLANKPTTDPMVMYSFKEVLLQIDPNISWSKFIANLEKYKLNSSDTTINPFEDIIDKKAGSLLKRLLKSEASKDQEAEEAKVVLKKVIDVVGGFARVFKEYLDVRTMVTPKRYSDETHDFVNKLTFARHSEGFRYLLSEVDFMRSIPEDAKESHYLQRLAKTTSLLGEEQPKSLRMLEGVFEVIRANSDEKADNFLFNAMVSSDNLKQAVKKNEIAKDILKGAVLSGLIKSYSATINLLFTKDIEDSPSRYRLANPREQAVIFDDILFKKYDAFMDRALKIFRPYI